MQINPNQARWPTWFLCDKKFFRKGVQFLQEPAERPYGVEAVLRDNSGNWLVLVEPRAFTPDDFR